jgi:phosphoacetylglucosamine mutase
MVTASHNPIHDNGLKMVDFNGEMLPISWEKVAESIANAEDLSSILQEKWSEAIHGTILIGHDNRPSSVNLVNCIKSAITSANSAFHDYGLMTTPQFHYLVNQCNLLSSIAAPEIYVKNIQNKVNPLFARFPGGLRYEKNLQLDCSGGVGFEVMKVLNYDWVELVNLDPSELNTNCGAEYAHKDRKLPRNMQVGKKSASFDGYADRLVYYYSAAELNVLEGERLTVLYAAAIKKLMADEGVSGEITVVSTGYSNFASIN